MPQNWCISHVVVFWTVPKSTICEVLVYNFTYLNTNSQVVFFDAFIIQRMVNFNISIGFWPFFSLLQIERVIFVGLIRWATYNFVKHCRVVFDSRAKNTYIHWCFWRPKTLARPRQKKWPCNIGSTRFFWTCKGLVRETVVHYVLQSLWINHQVWINLIILRWTIEKSNV